MQPKYVIAGWVAAAALAVVASVAAVGIVRGGLLSHPSQPMSGEEVQEELAQAPDGETRPSPSPSESGGGDGARGAGGSPSGEQPTGHLDSVPDNADPDRDDEAIFPSDGGTVLARCSDGMAELVWWVPEQGYRTDEDVVQGPAQQAEVEFEGGDREFEYTVTCAAGEPQAAIEADD